MSSHVREVFDEADATLGIDVRFFAMARDAATGETSNAYAGPDLDPYFTEIAGAEGQAQRSALRLVSTPSKLRDAPADGFDIRDHLLMIQSTAGLQALRAKVAAEVAKDEEVESVDVTITPNAPASSMTVQVDGQTATGPFTLVLAVSELSVEILRAA